ncbi:PE-PPE domain-containing protein [Mycobacterium vulneris]|uniref:acyltransferase PE n=1 Tax=Mycolicibacterium porcinum TaxID=39693 RepID=UPI00080AD18A|nr:acyltransferase PE [Mycolicibacterium porcinum]MBX8692141.1 PE-PPE domain-containing protein [Mycobacterium sp. 20091114027_K0903767]OCB42817.1 PE-PPE domain-containing protein [Mycolicibacterium vulneris]OCB57316.1 PE-PPE domain-containing protein [Mycolicibacterium vulneris]OCB62237.1 PE-PPE domain-containing protein [Mycolicibacterium vulneris]TVX99264.1 PE-PPE domain-containing protein [Mycolicibacterium porcinum]
MKKLLAGLALLMATSVTGSSGVLGSAWADDTPAPTPPPGGPAAGTPSNPGTAYALGGAHVLGIPYDEYIRMTGEKWFPGMKRTKVDYPAGQVQGHTLERFFPGIGALGEKFYPGIGLDGPSIGESVDEGEGNLDAAIRNGGKGTAMGLSEGALVLNAVKARLVNDPTAPPPDQLSFATFGDPIAKHPFGESFLTQNFPVGSVVPFMDYRIPAPVESQYHTDQYISAYDSIADWPDRPDNWMSVINAIAGLATGHTAIAFTDPSNVPAQNIRTTVNSKGATTTTYMVPEEHLPLVLPFKYLGYDKNTLNELDRVLLPMVDAGYSRNDDPATAPITVDPVHGFDPAEVTAPANEATFGGNTDPMSELANAALSVLNPHGAG